MTLLLAFRNNKLVWEGTYSQRKPILWQDHYIWWKSRQDHKMLCVVVVEDDFARVVGFLSISPLTYWSPEIGIIMGEKGYGTEAFGLGLKWLEERDYKYTSTTVLNTNKPMIHILKKLGFKRTCEARKGESRYAREL